MIPWENYVGQDCICGANRPGGVGGGTPYKLLVKHLMNMIIHHHHLFVEVLIKSCQENIVIPNDHGHH